MSTRVFKWAGLPSGCASVRGMVQVTVLEDGAVMLDFGAPERDPEGNIRIRNPYRSAVLSLNARGVTTIAESPGQLPDHRTSRESDALQRAIAWILTGKGRP